MAILKRDMTHAEIAAHLREEVCNTAQFETGRLVVWHSEAPSWYANPAYFGATRAVLSDCDYVAALYCGRNTPTEARKQLATSEKTRRFLKEVMAPGSGQPGYDTFAEHPYDLYRNGTVHLRAPKVMRDPETNRVVVWTLMAGREDGLNSSQGARLAARHLESCNLDNSTVALPLSVQALLARIFR